MWNLFIILHLNSLENWRRPPGHPRTVYIKTIHSSKTWNPITSPWMKQLACLRSVHSGDWCLRLALCTPSGAPPEMMILMLRHCHSLCFPQTVCDVRWLCTAWFSTASLQVWLACCIRQSCFSAGNPKCENAPGCGDWKRPTIKNPKYKGKWVRPTIDNPNYKVTTQCILWYRIA